MKWQIERFICAIEDAVGGFFENVIFPFIGFIIFGLMGLAGAIVAIIFTGLWIAAVAAVAWFTLASLVALA